MDVSSPTGQGNLHLEPALADSTDIEIVEIQNSNPTDDNLQLIVDKDCFTLNSNCVEVIDVDKDSDDVEIIENNEPPILIDDDIECVEINDEEMLSKTTAEKEALLLEEVCTQNRLLGQIIEECINLDGTRAMKRIINKILIPLYIDCDQTYKKSDEFQLSLKRTLSLLETAPFFKFSHIKNLCESLKYDNVKERLAAFSRRTARKLMAQKKRIKPIRLRRLRKRRRVQIVDLSEEWRVESEDEDIVVVNDNVDCNNTNIASTNKSMEQIINIDSIPSTNDSAEQIINVDSIDTNVASTNKSTEEIINDKTTSNNSQNKEEIMNNTETGSTVLNNIEIPSYELLKPAHANETITNIQNPSQNKENIMNNTQNSSNRMTNSNNIETPSKELSKPSHAIETNVKSVTNNVQNKKCRVNSKKNRPNRVFSNSNTTDSDIPSQELLKPSHSIEAPIDPGEFEHNRVKKIEDDIKELKNELTALEEMEVTRDDYTSPYVRSEQIKTKIVNKYKKICKIMGTEHTKRHEVKLQIAPGHPEGPAKCLQEYLNDNIDRYGNPPFPDIFDVVDCVDKANRIYNLKWNRKQIVGEAESLLKIYGKAIQKRRMKREWRDLKSLCKEEMVDPADFDPMLEARLMENRRIGIKNEEEILNRYARLEKETTNESGFSLTVENDDETDSEYEIVRETSLGNSNVNNTNVDVINKIYHDIIKDTGVDVANNRSHNIVNSDNVTVDNASPNSVKNTDLNIVNHNSLTINNGLDNRNNASSSIVNNTDLNIVNSNNGVINNTICNGLGFVPIFVNNTNLNIVNSPSTDNVNNTSQNIKNIVTSNTNTTNNRNENVMKDKLTTTDLLNNPLSTDELLCAVTNIVPVIIYNIPQSLNKEVDNIQSSTYTTKIDNIEYKRTIMIESELSDKDLLEDSKPSTNNLKEEDNISEIDVKVKKEREDTTKLLEELGNDFTATVFDIEDPFLVIEISDSSDSEDEDGAESL